MATFALVHGSWHGAWCWELVAPLLQEARHDVVTMDLPIEDPEVTFDTCADVVCSALDGWGDDVVAVGHSFGGMVIPLVAARRPLRHLVYLCAYVPAVGRSLADQMRDEPESFNPAAYKGFTRDEYARSVWIDNEIAREMMYADCDEDTVNGAIKRLRPHSTHPNDLPFPLTEFPSVPCTSVVCRDDQLLRIDWTKREAARLGADVIELPGGHSPFLSRPQVLADELVRIADTKA